MDTAVIAAAVAAVEAAGAPVTVDAWRPTVQGAVGHVVGVTTGDGAPAVLKVFPAVTRHRLATELGALRLLGAAGQVPVPQPLAHGVDDEHGIAVLLMTRLPGVRAADRRTELDEAATRALTEAVARLLRRVHAIEGTGFGSLPDPDFATACEFLSARADDALREFRELGAPSDLADRARGYVADRAAAIATCSVPALCHNDFIDGNLLVASEGVPTLCGVVDFERASWGDPLSDLAQTRSHVRHHDPHHVEYLTGAYGVATDAERQRVDAYEVVHTVRERSWIVTDRPAGWRASVAALDERLRRLTA